MKRITGVLAVWLGLAVAACAGEPGELPDNAEPIDVVVSMSVAAPGVVTAPATVIAEQQAELATRVSGTIRRMSVDIGAQVAAGDALATLDTGEIDARIESAQAAAQLARQWHKRIAALATDGAATSQELDDATARLEMAEAALRDVRAQRDYVALRAPFSGVITQRMADPGDLAVPGVPILTMIGTGSLKIEADLPAEMAGKLSAGDLLSVYRAETSGRYAARLTRVVPAVERASRRFRIEAQFEPSQPPVGIPPGTFVRIELNEPAEMTRWIPSDAIVKRGQLSGVFTLDGERLRLRWVRLGQQLGDAVELLAGPPASLALLREPGPAIADGQPVGNVSRVEWAPPFATQKTASVEGSR